MIRLAQFCWASSVSFREPMNTSTNAGRMPTELKQTKNKQLQLNSKPLASKWNPTFPYPGVRLTGCFVDIRVWQLFDVVTYSFALLGSRKQCCQSEKRSRRRRVVKFCAHCCCLLFDRVIQSSPKLVTAACSLSFGLLFCCESYSTIVVVVCDWITNTSPEIYLVVCGCRGN